MKKTFFDEGTISVRRKTGGLRSVAQQNNFEEISAARPVASLKTLTCVFCKEGYSSVSAFDNHVRRHNCSGLQQNLPKQNWVKLRKWYRSGPEVKFPDVMNFSGDCVTEKIFTTWLSKIQHIPLISAQGWFSDIQDGYPASDFESLMLAHEKQQEFTKLIRLCLEDPGNDMDNCLEQKKAQLHLMKLVNGKFDKELLHDFLEASKFAMEEGYHNWIEFKTRVFLELGEENVPSLDIPCCICDKPNRPDDFLLCEEANCTSGLVGHWDCLGFECIPCRKWWCEQHRKDLGAGRGYDNFSDDFVDTEGQIDEEITEKIADPDRWHVSASTFLNLDLDKEHRISNHEDIPEEAFLQRRKKRKERDAGLQKPKPKRIKPQESSRDSAESTLETKLTAGEINGQPLRKLMEISEGKHEYFTKSNIRSLKSVTGIGKRTIFKLYQLFINQTD